MIIKHPDEPGPLHRREVFGGPEQQPPQFKPDRDGTAAAEPVGGTRCRTWVTSLLARTTRCHVSAAILTFGRVPLIPEG